MQVETGEQYSVIQNKVPTYVIVHVDMDWYLHVCACGHGLVPTCVCMWTWTGTYMCVDVDWYLHVCACGHGLVPPCVCMWTWTRSVVLCSY